MAVEPLTEAEKAKLEIFFEYFGLPVRDLRRGRIKRTDSYARVFLNNGNAGVILPKCDTNIAQFNTKKCRWLQVVIDRPQILRQRPETLKSNITILAASLAGAATYEQVLAAAFLHAPLFTNDPYRLVPRAQQVIRLIAEGVISRAGLDEKYPFGSYLVRNPAILSFADANLKEAVENARVRFAAKGRPVRTLLFDKKKRERSHAIVLAMAS